LGVNGVVVPYGSIGPNGDRAQMTAYFKSACNNQRNGVYTKSRTLPSSMLWEAAARFAASPVYP